MIKQGLYPLGLALEERGLSVKQWRDLLEAKLVEPATRMADSKSYGLDEAGLQRLDVLQIARSAIVGRVTMTSLCFESAKLGLQVPFELTKLEVEIRLTRIFGYMNRTLQRYLGFKANHAEITQTDIYRAADRVSRNLTKKSTRNQVLARSFLKLSSSLMFGMIYGKSGSLGTFRNVRELILPFVQFDHTKLGLIGMAMPEIKQISTDIVFMMDGSRSMLTFDLSRNTMFTKLKTIPRDEFFLLIRLWPDICEIYWVGYDRVRSVIAIPQIPDKARQDFNVLILGTVISGFNRSSPNDVYRGILSNDLSPLREAIQSFVRLVEQAVELRKVIANLSGSKVR